MVIEPHMKQGRQHKLISTIFLATSVTKKLDHNTSVVFDDTREDNLKEKLALERKEKAEYAKKVGQLTMQVDWLKKI